MSTTVFVYIVFGVGLLWEGYSLIDSKTDTISKAIRSIKDRAPFVVYVGAVLLGHWFVQPPVDYVLASVLLEVFEVSIVTALGFIVFLWGRLRREAFWWEPAIILFLGIFIGSFIWTMGV